VQFYRWILKAIHEGKHEILMDEIKHWPGIRSIGGLIGWDTVETNAREWAVKSAQTIGHFTAKQIAGFTKNILLGTVNFFLTFFLVFFIFKDGKKIIEFIYTLTPLEERDKQEIFGQIGETFSAVIRGQILTALVQALVAGVIFWSLDLPLPVFFAALTFLISMIPIFGAATVWFPFVVYLYFIGDHWKAVTLFALGVGVISLIDNILKPILIGSKLKLPYLLLFLGILGGLKVYGMMGIFLAPTVLSLFFVLIRTYKERFLV
jgi:predicted PurR-regulated permease PerM